MSLLSCDLRNLVLTIHRLGRPELEDQFTSGGRQITDAEGNYRFDNLDPNETFYLEVVAWDGYRLSPSKVLGGVSSSQDSDFSNVTINRQTVALTDKLELRSGEMNKNFSAGFIYELPYKETVIPASNNLKDNRFGQNVILDQGYLYSFSETTIYVFENRND